MSQLKVLYLERFIKIFTIARKGCDSTTQIEILLFKLRVPGGTILDRTPAN